MADGRCGLRSGETIETNTVFLATGKHDLNAWQREGGTQLDLVGFKMHWKLPPQQRETLRNVMELFLFRGGYGGISLIENETANLCLVVRRKRLRIVGGWTELLAELSRELPHLHLRLENAVACWSKPLAISPIPYGYLDETADGVWRVGDQVAVIPSFTGDGMSIALHSGALAAQTYLKGGDAGAYRRFLRNHLRSSMGLASLVSRTMVATPGRVGVQWLGSILPSVITRIASLTRIPDEALLTGSNI